VRAQGHCSVFRFTLIKKGGRKKRELFIEIEEKKGGRRRYWNGGGIDLVRERMGKINENQSKGEGKRGEMAIIRIWI